MGAGAENADVDGWLDFLADLLWVIPWGDPLGPARRHKKESDFRLRVLAEAESTRLQDQARRDAAPDH